MFDLNGFVESGAFSGSAPSHFIVANDAELENRIKNLDEDTRREVRRHLNDFHSEEEMDRYIDAMSRGGRSIT